MKDNQAKTFSKNIVNFYSDDQHTLYMDELEDIYNARSRLVSSMGPFLYSLFREDSGIVEDYEYVIKHLDRGLEAFFDLKKKESKERYEYIQSYHIKLGIKNSIWHFFKQKVDFDKKHPWSDFPKLKMLNMTTDKYGTLEYKSKEILGETWGDLWKTADLLVKGEYIFISDFILDVNENLHPNGILKLKLTK